MREYSIPHLRREGRISIPEDSFDRIREARDLHKEGLLTESVRRTLREGGAPDSGALDRRLNTLHQTVEDLREDVSFSPNLRTILARQSLLMSAVFNLTEMVEELMIASGKPRKRIFEDIETNEEPSQLPGRGRFEIPGEIAASTAPVPTTEGHNVDGMLAVHPTDFGALSRRRRRGVLAILAALALAACLAWTITTLLGTNNTQSSVPRVTETAAQPPEAPKATPAHGASGQAEKPTIPNVSGQSLEEAVKTISGEGFEVASIETETSRRVPETAIRTKPTSGAPAKPGAPVTLTMSAGPPIPASSATSTATASATASPSPAYAN